MILHTFGNPRCELDVWGTGRLPKVQTQCIFVPQCATGCEDGGDDFVCLADEDGIAEIKVHSKRHGITWIRGILFEHLLLLKTAQRVDGSVDARVSWSTEGAHVRRHMTLARGGSREICVPMWYPPFLQR